MTHVRKQIRDRAAVVIDGLTTTGTNVFKSRLFPFQQSNLPAWTVVTNEEEIAESISMSKTQERELTLQFSGYARAIDGDTLEDTLDLMAEELETVVVLSAFPNLLKKIEYQSTEYEFDVDDTDQVFGEIAVIYRVLYYTAEGDPSTAL